MKDLNIYIPSKNRANNCKTANELLNYGHNTFKIVVEPQDYDSYIEHYNKENVLVLDKNDQGLGYSRQYTKEYDYGLNNEFHWTLDDDLRFFTRIKIYDEQEQKVKGKNIPADPMLCFKKIESVVDNYSNIGQAGLIHQAFAWTKKTDIDYNKQCSSAFMINNTTKAKMRLRMKQDTDYSMQILNEGWVTMNFNKYLYDNPPFGKVEGGLTDEYKNNAEELQRELIKLWPVFEQEKVIGKEYATRIKPNRVWNKFQQRPIWKQN